MQFDDRLATVLRMRVNSAAAMRTQFRQLLDLLGTAAPEQGRSAAGERAYNLLAQLRDAIPPAEQASILREAGLRLRSADLAEFLASGEPRTAASAMATARLTEQEWADLIPRLPLVSRGFLRHRRDLPPAAMRLLGQLGVGDLVLSDGRQTVPAPLAERGFADTALPVVTLSNSPQRQEEPPIPSPEPAKIAHPVHDSGAPTNGTQAIGEIIERIEQFRSSRRFPVLAPRLPLGDAPPPDSLRIMAFDAVTDAAGQVTWASANVAPWLVGMILTGVNTSSLARLAPENLTSIARRQPLHEAALTIAAAPAISGQWRIDAAPAFVPVSGAFSGFRCRAQRVQTSESSRAGDDSYADQMRQTLHELRTPVNAIQGFAEIIQQQLFGPAPHEYRAHAAAIGVDSARLLAGLEDLERLARLESSAAAPEVGEGDLRIAVDETLRRLAPVVGSRDAEIRLSVTGSSFALAIAQSEVMAICWRLLASAAAALDAGEKIALKLESDEQQIKLDLGLPLKLREQESLGQSSIGARSAVSTGLFGPQFAFRLVSAEVRAAGGKIYIYEANLTLTMPVLTGPPATNSRSDERASA